MFKNDTGGTITLKCYMFWQSRNDATKNNGKRKKGKAELDHWLFWGIKGYHLILTDPQTVLERNINIRSTKYEKRWFEDTIKCINTHFPKNKIMF